MHATRTPLALDLLLTADQRRPSAVEKVIDFRKSIESPDPRFDEIDLELDEEIIVDPYAGDPPSRRSDKEIGRLLDLLDSIANSKERRNH